MKRTEFPPLEKLRRERIDLLDGAMDLHTQYLKARADIIEN